MKYLVPTVIGCVVLIGSSASAQYVYQPPQYYNPPSVYGPMAGSTPSYIPRSRSYNPSGAIIKQGGRTLGGYVLEKRGIQRQVNSCAATLQECSLVLFLAVQRVLERDALFTSPATEVGP